MIELDSKRLDSQSPYIRWVGSRPIRLKESQNGRARTRESPFVGDLGILLPSAILWVRLSANGSRGIATSAIRNGRGAHGARSLRGSCRASRVASSANTVRRRRVVQTAHSLRGTQASGTALARRNPVAGWRRKGTPRALGDLRKDNFPCFGAIRGIYTRKVLPIVKGEARSRAATGGTSAPKSRIWDRLRLLRRMAPDIGF